MNNLDFFSEKREIKLDPGKEIVFKLSAKLELDYINEYFTEFSGYMAHNILGSSIKSSKHSDIPKVITKIIDEHVANKKNINLIIKNEVKDGRFYWYLTDFKYNTNRKGELISVTYYRKPPSRTAIRTLEVLYKKLVDIEKHSSIEVAEKFLFGLLEEKDMTFEEYTTHLSQEVNDIVPSPIRTQAIPKKKKSIIDVLFKK